MARTDPPLEPWLPAAPSERAPPRAPRTSGAWVEAWHARVHGMALALTRERAAAEDLAQEVFVRALAATEPAHGEGLGPWLYRIARNAWIDGLRAKARGARGAPVPREAAASEPSVEEPPVVTAWKGLPEDERLVVWLRLMVDVPFRDIAQLLDTSKSSVDRTFRRALERLRREFAP